MGEELASFRVVPDGNIRSKEDKSQAKRFGLKIKNLGETRMVCRQKALSPEVGCQRGEWILRMLKNSCNENTIALNHL